jgi:hypothetical protein
MSMTPSRKAPEPSPETAAKRKRSRPTIASLSRELVAVRKERDAITLKLETARRTLVEITSLVSPADAEANSSGLGQAVKLACDAAQSIDVSALLTEIRSAARLEAGQDTARLDALDSLVGDGGVGFGWQQIRGTYIQFRRITPKERTRIGFFSPANAVRTLLDEVIREKRTRNQQKIIFAADCKPPATDRKRSGK